MNSQAAAILWAQLRALRNILPRRGRLGTFVTVSMNVVWYGLWVFGAAAVMLLIREVHDRQILFRFFGPGLLLCFLYWQVIPVIMASAGASLQMRRLRVYPIPHSQLFHLEVMLRVTTAFETVILLMGTSAGVILNPTLPSWYALVLVPFALFNLYMSAGIRDLITRMLSWRRFREAMLFFVVMLAALPQIVLRSGVPKEYQKYFDQLNSPLFPWTAAAYLLSGDWRWINIVSLFGWLAVGYAFGRWQFEKGLRFDEEAARAHGDAATKRDSWTERIFQLPSVLLRDPMGAMVEKELRSLVRSPRFRIVFLMGFTFGLMIWFPMAFRKERPSMIQSHYLVIVSAYSILLLSEVGVWNVLGFDRSAAQLYWLAPVRTVMALVAKNIATACFVTMEVILISGVCVLFRLPVSFPLFVEALLVCMVMLMFLTAIGNVSSLRFPRPMDPNESWKRAAGSRFQVMLVFLYPVIGLPFLFAYYAQYKWESDVAFYAVLAFTAAAAAVAYGFSLEKASAMAADSKERILSVLGQGSGPVSS